jgi:hypothetical protein
LDVSYANKQILKGHDTKFLGLLVDSTLSWKPHIDQVLHNLSIVCCALRSIKPYMSQEVMKMVYHAYFHSTMLYGIIFWGNSADSQTIFKMQKRAIRTIAGSKNRDLCRDLLKNLKILPFYSQYIFSLLIFVIENKSMYNLNSDIYNINTMQKFNFHQYSTNLALYQTGVYSFGIKVFSNLPQTLKMEIDNNKQFKIALKQYLHTPTR